MKKITRIVIAVIAIAIVVMCVYLLLPIGDAGRAVTDIYDSLTNNSSVNMVNRKHSFVSSYTYTTGDITLAMKMGYTKEQAEVLTGGGDDDGGGGDDRDPFTAPDDSGLSIAMTICQTFTNSSGAYHYSQSGSAASEAVVGDRSKKSPRRDCSAFVSTFLYLSKRTTGFNNWTSSSYHSGVFGRKQSYNENTLASVLEVGDVLWKSGHVAVVSAVDNEYVYIADAGDTGPITRTATTGYDKKISREGPLSQWRSNVAIEVYRLEE